MNKINYVYVIIAAVIIACLVIIFMPKDYLVSYEYNTPTGYGFGRALLTSNHMNTEAVVFIEKKIMKEQNYTNVIILSIVRLGI